MIHAHVDPAKKTRSATICVEKTSIYGIEEPSPLRGKRPLWAGQPCQVRRSTSHVKNPRGGTPNTTPN